MNEKQFGYIEKTIKFAVVTGLWSLLLLAVLGAIALADLVV